MKTLQNITWIYTYNLDETAKFYSDTLGLTEVLDQGMCRVFRTSLTGFIGICQRPDRHVEPKGVIMSLITEDVDGWYRHLKESGADIETEPSYSERSQAYAFFCRAPEGYRIEFQHFRDPRWSIDPAARLASVA